MKVLFIGGAGRSGSTLLETILGQIDGVVSVGEFNEIWKAGLVENRLCGCGRRFLECGFWATVFGEAFGGFDKIDIGKLVDAQNGSCRVRHIPQMIFPFLQSERFNNRAQIYRNANKALFEGIRKVTNAKVIVDSSKTAAQAYMLGGLENVELYILQLVRDSRAVAYSWQRTKNVPDLARGNPEMVRKTPLASAMHWNLRNAFLETLKITGAKRFVAYDVLKYESFVRSPLATITSLMVRLDVHSGLSAIFPDAHVVSRHRVTHTLEGNPSKFKAGNIDIRADEEWRERMRASDRRVVSALTAIHRWKFGYK